MAWIFEHFVDGRVEVSEDDGGVRVLGPEAANGLAEQLVVVLDHAVDAAEAANVVVGRLIGGLPGDEHAGQATARWVARHHHVRRAVFDQPLPRKAS